MAFLTNIGSFVTGHASLFGFAYVCIEYWLGKTDVVAAGSVPEAILSGAAKLLAYLGVKA